MNPRNPRMCELHIACTDVVAAGAKLVPLVHHPRGSLKLALRGPWNSPLYNLTAKLAQLSGDAHVMHMVLHGKVRHCGSRSCC